MNKWLLGSFLFGGLFALVIFTFFSSSVLSIDGERTYESNTAIYIRAENHEYHISPLESRIKISNDGKFDLFFLLNSGIGFSSGGKFKSDDYRFNLNHLYHEKINQDNAVELWEKMIIRKGSHLSGDVMFFPISDDEFIAFGDYAVFLYTAV